MYDLNNVSLIGRLVHSPRAKTTQEGKKLCEFSLANNPGGKNDPANFFDCIAFGKVAENIVEYVEKGSPVAVTGRLTQKRWTSKEGVRRQKIIVYVTMVSFLASVPGHKIATEADLNGTPAYSSFNPNDADQVPF